MERLKRIIGLAPSEMSPGELREKLRSERLRVSSMLQAFREAPLKGSPKKGGGARKGRKKDQTKEFIKMAEELNMTVEEAIELAKRMKEKERKGK